MLDNTVPWGVHGMSSASGIRGISINSSTQHELKGEPEVIGATNYLSSILITNASRDVLDNKSSMLAWQLQERLLLIHVHQGR
jgi:hypothetical protein